MKKRLTKVVLGALLASTPMIASEFSFNTNSLFGIEGGISTLNDEGAGGSGLGETSNFGSYGLKVGAESQNYRVFVSANYHDIENFSYAYTYGATLQYKFNFAEKFNFFLGINGGYANMEINNVSISDPYFGGDAGFNFHASKLIDLELGGRVMKIDNDIVDNMVSGYASIIFKYQMD
jgi:hypothetical protein